MIGETIASVLATHFIETKGLDVNTTSSAVLAERDSLIYKFLPIIHRVLVENEINDWLFFRDGSEVIGASPIPFERGFLQCLG